MDINIVNAEALKVGPDEVLIIKLRGDAFPDEMADDAMKEINELLVHVGLKDRSFILMGDDIEFVVAKQDKSLGIAADYADSAE